MATGQGILDRMKRAKAEKAVEPKRGVLPLAAFYGREPEQERLRNRFYLDFLRVMAMPDAEPDALAEAPARRRSYLLLDMRDSVAILDADASPVEFLISRGEMETAEDEEGMSGVRYHAALRLRDIVDGAQIKGMRSPALGSIGGGGGGSSNIPGYQLDCMAKLGRIKEMMPAWMASMIEAVVVGDDWLDLRPASEVPEHRRPAWRRNRRETVAALHYGLDIVGIELKCLTWKAFRTRWRGGEPAVPPAVRRKIATRSPVS